MPDAPEPVAFDTAFTSLLRAAGPARTPELEARLRALGVEPGRLVPAYPLATWVAAIQAVAAARFPEAPPEEGYFLTGKAYLVALESTALGAAIFALGRLIGTDRSLARFGRNTRSSNNYTETEWRSLGEREAELVSRMAPAFLPRAEGLPTEVLPQFSRGILTGIGLVTGAPGIRVELVAADPARRSATYRLRW